MFELSRRDLFRGAALAAGAATAPAAPTDGLYDWIRHPRILLAEAYNYPFYPAYRYSPEKALKMAKSLNADSLRFPAASFYAYYPTRTKYPIHPELGSEDPLKRTIELFHDAGLKVVIYVPFNHPFMDPADHNPNYEDWIKRDANGKPMMMSHFGYPQKYESCIFSPFRQEIYRMVEELMERYPMDVMYFDGPYQGFSQGICQCRYCQQAWREADGTSLPTDRDDLHDEKVLRYRVWLRDQLTKFMGEVRSSIRKVRDVPVLHNNTAMLTPLDPRTRAHASLDGFMFEASDSPEQKLFNLQLGRSTGKVIWTYIGHHTQHNREHLADRSIRGWMGAPVESEDLALDGMVAQTAGVGMIYWGVARFWDATKDPTSYESGKYIRSVYDFSARHGKLLTSLKPQPQAGVMVPTQTLNFFRGHLLQPAAYRHYYYGAWQLLKDNGYDAEPFVDYETTVEKLSRYRLVYLPNAACLSTAQCAAIRAYVEQGGTVLATHLTSAADELGRVRPDFALGDLFGAKLKSIDPREFPDLYLRAPGGAEIIPQDPQIVDFTPRDGARVIAETYDRGRQLLLGPAITECKTGKGRVLYVGSALEAAYYETRISAFRRYVGTLVDPVLNPERPYTLEYRPGLIAHLMTSRETLLLHLLADIGNKWKETAAREQFVPIENVKARVRVPAGATVKAVSLLRAGTPSPHVLRDGWVEVTIPRVLMHEAIRVDLA